MKRAVAIILAALVALGVWSWNRPAPGKPSRVQKKPKVEQTAVAQLDTVVKPDSVRISGFEKQLRATRETMFVTNRTQRPLEWLEIEVSYLDMKGRMLHKATHSLTVDIPPGESRLIDIPTFDRQNLFYYHRTGVSRRALQATPFKVAVEVLRICHPLND